MGVHAWRQCHSIGLGGGVSNYLHELIQLIRFNALFNYSNEINLKVSFNSMNPLNSKSWNNSIGVIIKS